MEQVHGIDVSWMTHGSPKEKAGKSSNSRRSSVSAHARDVPAPTASPPAPTTEASNATATPTTPTATANGHAEPANGAVGAAPTASTPSRPVFSRSSSAEKTATANGGSTPPQRRGSWFANISSKFSSSSTPGSAGAAGGSGAGGAQAAATGSPSQPGADWTAAPPVPKITPPKNAVLQHANRPEGEGPYTPAPPRSGQVGFLGVFRRLSSSGGVLGPGGVRGGIGIGGGSGSNNHGLVERRILNIDRRRERCDIAELNQAKLRRVAFCVDVEIAPMPRYGGNGADAAGGAKKPDKAQKLKSVKGADKGEGEVLKHSKAHEEHKDNDGSVDGKAGAVAAGESEKDKTKVGVAEPASEAAVTVLASTDDKEKDSSSKKKEKKKKSEEERKARKEKKRKLAEANGTIPMEIHYDSSDSAGEVSVRDGPTTPRTTSLPTTNPVRIYRRCCQLRETPILKKITEQLASPTNAAAETGGVAKLDLTGYWLQLADLVTLGDYLAVVPVKEVLLENCGLTDEGLRVILSGLLAVRRADPKRRRPHSTDLEGSAGQGGVVERLVLKNNKIGPEGWKHICLFIYLCRSIKCLDLSGVQFPRPPAMPSQKQQQSQPQQPPAQNGNGNSNGNGIGNGNGNGNGNGIGHAAAVTAADTAHDDMAHLLSRSVGNRLAGADLELLNLGETDPTPGQLSIIMDGIARCGVRRLGLSHNHIDAEGAAAVARYLRQRKCEGLDLGGNDLRDHVEVLAQALGEDDPLWALSLADCNLQPKSLCKIIPQLVKLRDFLFIDLSHNRDLFETEPGSVSILRRYLPKMVHLKRIHLADVAMTAEQAIAIAEVLPEVKSLAHINLLENAELAKLADATTEDMQEEACALYASLLAATRVSKTIVCVDVDVPSERSGEIVKAIAKQVVAYCLRNMERFPDAEINRAVSAALAETQHGAAQNGNGAEGGDAPIPYPDVLMHLVGHDVMNQDETDAEAESAPDEDYVIGGTGVVKALACCLKNRGDESRRQSGEFIRGVEDGSMASPPAPSLSSAASSHLPPGKAKDMSKHLLMSARKIRRRLQPALAKARLNPSADEHNYRKLMFLDKTLAGIIKRFEDEFPDTRVAGATPHALHHDADGDAEAAAGDGDNAAAAAAAAVAAGGAQLQHTTSSTASAPDSEPYPEAVLSEGEDDTAIHVRPLSRSNSILSSTSRAINAEEGRVLRAGHRFRADIITREHYDMLNTLDEISSEPNHARMLQELIEEIGDPQMLEKLKTKGVVTTFREDKEQIVRRLREIDPDHWERFRESQFKARANVEPGVGQGLPPVENGLQDGGHGKVVADENAIED